MGCDIHAYVEYGKSVAGRPIYWRNMTRNFGNRDYLLFGVMAGVRVKDAQLFAPKGMPQGDLSYYTQEDYWVRVAPEASPDYADMEGYTTLERAQSWLKYGSVAEYDQDGRIRRVSGPDWHSHSWLTASELEQVLKHYARLAVKYERESNDTVEWDAILAAMRTLEAGGWQARVVFWFDN